MRTYVDDIIGEFVVLETVSLILMTVGYRGLAKHYKKELEKEREYTKVREAMAYEKGLKEAEGKN